MRNIWLISDTHFSHENIIKYCNRPFVNADEMNSFMMQKWAETVKQNDIVYHLGDVYSKKCPDLSKLPGRKRLLLGNHDKGKDQKLFHYFEKIFMWRMFPEFEMLLTHVPVHISTLSESPKRPKLLNVHGHTHLNAEPDGDTENYKCVCVEFTNYTPINIEDILHGRKRKNNTQSTSR